MQDSIASQRKLLLVDDDPVFLRCLQRVMERRGYLVTACQTLTEARQHLARTYFDYATIDLRLSDGSGLDLLEEIRAGSPPTRALILTGYGNVATAVTATKLGAVDYIAKPADADTIEAALHGRILELERNETFPRPEVQEFRYLLAMYERHGRNMSETARAASMHRRTLQRILRRHGIGPSEQVPPEARMERPHLRRLVRLWMALLDGPKAGQREESDPGVIPSLSRQRVS